MTRVTLTNERQARSDCKILNANKAWLSHLLQRCSIANCYKIYPNLLAHQHWRTKTYDLYTQLIKLIHNPFFSICITESKRHSNVGADRMACWFCLKWLSVRFVYLCSLIFKFLHSIVTTWVSIGLDTVNITFAAKYEFEKSLPCTTQSHIYIYANYQKFLWLILWLYILY